MNQERRFRFVVDTNVLFEGLTAQHGASGYVIDAWRAGLFVAHVSNALAYEYADVLSRKLSSTRWQRLRPVLGRLLNTSEFVGIYYRWRPISPDPGDDHLIDCAMNGGASIITWNVKDFRLAEEALGLAVLTPVQAVRALTEV